MCIRDRLELFDTGIAMLAGLMIIPAVFAFSGGDMATLQAGPSLMFITIPKVDLYKRQFINCVYFNTKMSNSIVF